jgi:hypothetical protein
VFGDPFLAVDWSFSLLASRFSVCRFPFLVKGCFFGYPVWLNPVDGSAWNSFDDKRAVFRGNGLRRCNPRNNFGKMYGVNIGETGNTLVYFSFSIM